MQTESPSTAAEIAEYIAREPKRMELANRETQIAMILAACFECDREVKRGEALAKAELGCDKHAGAATAAATRHADLVVPHPHRIYDLLSATLPYVQAQLAAILYRPTANLVDRCLDVSAEWNFYDWSHEKQIERLRLLFEEARIGDRFALPYWASLNDEQEVGT